MIPISRSRREIAAELRRWLPAMNLPTLALLCLCLGMSSCVSVPLSTIVRMSTFDDRDFVQLDPDVLRVRIKLPQAFKLNPEKSWLGVKVASAAGVHDGEFKLEQVAKEQTELSRGMFSSNTPGTAYTLRLSPPSRQKFRELQGFVRRGQPGEVTITVAPRLSSFPDDASVVNVWIDLLLSPGQGYFTLLDSAEVPMEAIRAASTGG